MLVLKIRIMKKLSAIFLSIILFSFVATSSNTAFANAAGPAPAAQCALNEIYTDFGCFPNDPIGFSQKFYGYGLGFIAGLSLLVLILGGYRVLTSQGDPTRVNEGKSYIFYAISGLLLAIFGFVFIEVIVVDILHVPGFK